VQYVLWVDIPIIHLSLKFAWKFRIVRLCHDAKHHTTTTTLATIIETYMCVCWRCRRRLGWMNNRKLSFIVMSSIDFEKLCYAYGILHKRGLCKPMLWALVQFLANELLLLFVDFLFNYANIVRSHNIYIRRRTLQGLTSPAADAVCGMNCKYSLVMYQYRRYYPCNKRDAEIWFVSSGIDSLFLHTVWWTSEFLCSAAFVWVINWFYTFFFSFFSAFSQRLRVWLCVQSNLLLFRSHNRIMSSHLRTNQYLCDRLCVRHIIVHLFLFFKTIRFFLQPDVWCCLGFGRPEGLFYWI
jgi:hypothetical protein